MSIGEAATILGACLALCTFGGLIVFNILKAQFPTKEDCKESRHFCFENHSKNQDEIEKKISEMINRYHDNQLHLTELKIKLQTLKEVVEDGFRNLNGVNKILQDLPYQIARHMKGNGEV